MIGGSLFLNNPQWVPEKNGCDLISLEPCLLHVRFFGSSFNNPLISDFKLELILLSSGNLYSHNEILLMISLLVRPLKGGYPYYQNENALETL